jgi:hypothetical protein
VPAVTTRLAAPLSSALVLALASSAAAAQMQTDRACYATPSSGTVAVTVSANDLDPSQPFAITLDGRAIASGTTDATGAIATTIAVPRLSAGKKTLTHTLVLTEGANTASTTFGVARVSASFAPTVGTPSKLRVHFTGTGFALQKADPSVYVHEVDPLGHVARTFALGHATGPCGTIAANKTRKLFPAPPRHGIWHLQFDTSPAYHRGTAASLFYTLAVIVSR